MHIKLEIYVHCAKFSMRYDPEKFVLMVVNFTCNPNNLSRMIQYLL